MTIKKDFPLKELNTFGLNVKAKKFAEVFSETDLKEIIRSNELKKHPFLILGGGSNILFTKDFDGMVIKISIPGIEVMDNGESGIYVKAGAGVVWHELVLFCLEKGYGSLENLSLIPGTVGAAPIQNIGAYGVELKDVFCSLSGLNIETGTIETYDKEECRFGYRTSIFKNELKNKFIITQVTLELQRNPALDLSYGAIKNEIEKLGLKNPTIKDVSDTVIRIRQSKLPDPKELGNAGSFFKNPIISEEKYSELKNKFNDINGYQQEQGKIKIPAGWMIEKAGWKGKRIGNAGSHNKQSLVLVNYGSATGEEVLKLAESIKNSVFDKFGIKLEEEVNVV